jgi:vesicle-fusing ATPase
LGKSSKRKEKMSTLYKVVPTPSDALTLTNLVYVPPGTVPGAGKLIEVAGFVFTLGESADVAAGTVAFNARQRACSKLSTTVDAIPLIEYKITSAKPLSLIKVEMEFATKPPAGTPVFTIDATIMSKNILHMLSGQVLSTGQAIVSTYNDKKFIVNVRSVEMPDVGGDKKVEKVTRGLVRPDTVIIFARSDAQPINYTNLPEGTEAPPQDLFPEGFNFEMTGIGGLGKQLEEIFRRAFESRLYPKSIQKKLKTRHVKGVLLYGPPGTGKTLIAKKLSAMLGCKNLKIVTGPEMFDKYVGQTEANIRGLFSAAEAEMKAKGDDSALHIIVFDEFDSMVKQRGSTRDGTGVHDSAVNQLLSKIDGPEELNNILLIAMTNRRDLIDEAVLRPGRFECHVEITIPNEEGRFEIFQIKTDDMLKNGLMDPTVDLRRLAALSKNYSGAEIEGVVNNAQSYAMHRHVDMKNPTKFKNPELLMIKQADFEAAIAVYKPALGISVDELENLTRNGLIDYGMMWNHLLTSCMSYVDTLRQSTRLSSISLLLEGPHGAGKSALAAHVARSSGFPYVKVVKPEMYVGYGELAKCNAIRQAFEDADRSPMSCVIVDDIERLIEYVHVGQRFSNAVLQTLLIMIKRQPPEGKKLLVLGTTSNPELMESLEVAGVFYTSKPVLPLGRDEAMCVVKQLGVKFISPEEESKTMEVFPRDIPVKRLMLVVERAISLGSEDGARSRGLTSEDFAAALS